MILDAQEEGNICPIITPTQTISLRQIQPGLCNLFILSAVRGGVCAADKGYPVTPFWIKRFVLADQPGIYTTEAVASATNSQA